MLSVSKEIWKYLLIVSQKCQNNRTISRCNEITKEHPTNFLNNYPGNRKLSAGAKIGIKTFTYSFPLFAQIGRVFWKVQHHQNSMIIITHWWKAQIWFPWLLQTFVKNPLLLLSEKQDLVRDKKGKDYLLIQ